MPSNKAGRYADERAKFLTGEIVKVFKEAARDVSKKLVDFTSKHEAKDAHYRQLVREGKLTEAWYRGWQKGQVFTGKLWQQKLDDLTRIYCNADKEARAIIRGETENVFRHAMNYTASDISDHFKGAISFTLYDKQTIEYMIKADRKLLPEWKIDEQKDYTWNANRIQNAVLQGIIQGESIEKIAKRLSGELATKNAKKMNMFARTAVTAARSEGQIARMKEAQEQGIKIQKQWMTAGDDRVREAHDEIDGEVRDLDEPFETSDGEIMYPGDPNAAPELVYNCRCDLFEFYPRYAK